MLLTAEERRDYILSEVRNLVITLLVNDRMEDPVLSVGDIEQAVASWELTPGELALTFEEALREAIPADYPHKVIAGVVEK